MTGVDETAVDDEDEALMEPNDNQPEADPSKCILLKESLPYSTLNALRQYGVWEGRGLDP